MVLASVPAGIVRYTLGVQPGELTGTGISEVELLNQAQEVMCNARPWRWLKRQSVPLSLYANQAWVDLPTDFRELLKVMPSQALLQQMQECSLEEILDLRTSAIGPAGLLAYYYSVENAVPETKNLLGSTEAFADTALWTAAAVTVTSNAGTSPTGATTADLIVSGGSPGRLAQSIDKSRLFTGRPYVASIYMKAGTATSNDLELRQQGPSATPETSARSPETIARVTWSGGVPAVTLQSSQGIGVHGVGSESVGDSWYRVWVTMTYDDDESKPNAEMAMRIRPDTTAGLGSVNVWGAQIERWDGTAEDAVPSRYAPNAGAVVESFGEPVRRLAIWPTPTSDTLGAFSLLYRRRPRRITLETETIEIPTWIEPLYFEACRIVARGSHEEDDAALYLRMDELRRSHFFNDAVEQDEGEQRSLGRMRGLACEAGANYRNWDTGIVELP